MDIYGYISGLFAKIHELSNHQKGTGRTTTLVTVVQDQDIVIFAQEQEARRVEKLFSEAHKTVHCIKIDPRNMRKVEEVRCAFPNSSVWFDHTWLELFMSDALLDIRKCLDIVHKPRSVNKTATSLRTRG